MKEDRRTNKICSVVLKETRTTDLEGKAPHISSETSTLLKLCV